MLESLDLLEEGGASWKDMDDVLRRFEGGETALCFPFVIVDE